MNENDDKKISLTVSDNAARLFKLNPQINFTATDLRAINAGQLVAIGPRPDSVSGCITLLRYGKNDTDLVLVLFDSGDFLTPAKATNLNDFRETFQTAANFGFGVSACLYTQTKQLRMVNLRPCSCKCDD